MALVDFGFSTEKSLYKQYFSRCGTPGYVAPEVLNDLEYDCKTDNYSCGVILYILLLGEHPFHGNTYKEIVTKNMKGDIYYDHAKLKEFSPHTIDLLKRLLEKDPVKRISSEDALEHKAFYKIVDMSPTIRPKEYSH